MTPERLQALGKQASQMIEKIFPDDVKLAVLDMPLHERVVFWGLILSCIGGALVRCVNDDPQITKSIWDLVGGEVVKLAQNQQGAK